MQEIEKNLKFIAADHTLAKNVAEHLEKKYPGWLWAVHVMDGVVGVKSLRLSGNWGFVLHEDKIDNDYIGGFSSIYEYEGLKLNSEYVFIKGIYALS